ncbi:hypothetical protein ABZ357_07535 [Streptomyces sp. NPDC005917]|uniref:hypothetical protein n=1 Tax=unclassified Streptomyces TaxID=2593676 RepID=UPI0033C085C5
MTSLQDPVMDLARASLEPSTKTARVRADSPVCQVVIQAAEADLATGGADNVNMLAIGAGVAAAGLTSWLAQERDRDTAAIIADFEKTATVHGFPRTPLVEMLKTLLTGPTGTDQTADFMVQLFHDDEEAFYDLIVDLGGYIASCIGLLAAHGISNPDASCVIAHRDVQEIRVQAEAQRHVAMAVLGRVGRRLVDDQAAVKLSSSQTCHWRSSVSAKCRAPHNRPSVPTTAGSRPGPRVRAGSVTRRFR